MLEVHCGLLNHLFLRPRIHLIAASKRIIGRFLKIVFFELNGLPHGEIDLLSAPECDKFRVGKIAFDAEEHVMAVLFLPVDSTDSSALPFGRCDIDYYVIYGYLISCLMA